MSTNIPLAERLRPKKIEDFIAQTHLIGEKSPLMEFVKSGKIPSMIFWGPPGVGKTTLANVIAKEIGSPFYTLSAISSGVKDVRSVFENVQNSKSILEKTPILFIDEIHRFSKAQQDSLLGAVEKGIVTLIGATTENPSFEVISPLLSRCQVYILKEFTADDLKLIINRALEKDYILKGLKIKILEYNALLRHSGGDARKLLNILEIVVNADIEKEVIEITDERVGKILQKKLADYDKNGELHYDIISAFIKSIRGSDPNATVYWLARMIAGGEDLKFIARRLVILASEDIGLANPNAMLLANSCFDAVNKIGYPESQIILSETAVYLATSPKSNSTYMAINEALDLVEQTGDLSVPLHLRNSPTKLMKELGYGKGYKYAHNYKDNFVEQDFLPEEIKDKVLYRPQNNTSEIKILEKLKQMWNKYC